MAIIFKIIKMTDCVATRNKMICLFQLKRKLLNCIADVTIIEKKLAVKMSCFVLFLVDLCHFPYSLIIGWSKKYIV